MGTIGWGNMGSGSKCKRKAIKRTRREMFYMKRGLRRVEDRVLGCAFDQE